MSVEAMAIIHEVAATVGESLNAVPSQRMDCRYACAAWKRALRRREVDVEMQGGEGVDDPVFRDYRLVPLDLRSGYREGDDRVHRHFWLGVGAERRVFDPTAHQFDDTGGVSLDRYTLDGEALSSRRRSSATG